MRFTFVVVLSVLFILVPIAVSAGELAAPAAPDNAASAMHTVEDIYNRLDNGAATEKRTGAFTEPAAAPAATGHSLNDVMDKAPALDDTAGAAPADVRTGKKFWGLRNDGWGLQEGTLEDTGGSSYPIPLAKTGDSNDGDRGIAYPDSRFTVNDNSTPDDASDDTVTDNLTGLMWTKNANMASKTWEDAKSYCEELSHAGHNDWHLPNVNELLSLIDRGKANPALPEGHPFSDVQNFYWSSTACSGVTSHAWDVNLGGGGVYADDKTNTYTVWPVRGGQ